MMKITIYGKPNCPYCNMAKELGEHLQNQDKATLEYIDMLEQSMGSHTLERITGKPVTSVPQIFINGTHIGGFAEMNRLVGGL